MTLISKCDTDSTDTNIEIFFLQNLVAYSIKIS